MTAGILSCKTTTWNYRLPNAWGDNRYAIHQFLWRAFPHNQPVKQHAPFRFRVEADVVLVQAIGEPVGIPNAKAEVFSWKSGDEGRLKIHLNIHRRKNGNDKPVEHDDVLPFVERALYRTGVSVVDEDLSIIPFKVRGTNGVPVFPVSIDAGIRVDDNVALLSAVTTGIGRRKYLGFGMLILTR